MIPIIMLFGELAIFRAIYRLKKDIIFGISDTIVGLTAIVAGTLMMMGGVSWHALGWNLTAMPFIVAATLALIAVCLTETVWLRMLFLALLGFYAWHSLHTSWWVFAFALVAAAALILFRVCKRSRHKFWFASTLVAIIASSVVAANTFSSLEYTLLHNSGRAADVQELRNLTVEQGELIPAGAKCTDDTFNTDSLPGRGHLKYTDSVSTPFTSTDKDKMFEELIDSIHREPTTADAFAQAFSIVEIGKIKMKKENPWLVDFMQKSERDGLRTAWLTHKEKDGSVVTDTDGTETLFVTNEFCQKSELVSSLLYTFDNQGVKEGRTSKIHWPSMQLAAGELPRAYAERNPDKQDSKPFLALVFTTKTPQDCPYVIGVNIEDKRPELFDCKDAKKIAPAQPKKEKPADQPKVEPTKPTEQQAKPSAKVTPTEVTHKAHAPKEDKPHKTSDPKEDKPQKTEEPTPATPTESQEPSPSETTQPPVESETPSVTPSEEPSETPSVTPSESESPSTTPTEEETPTPTESETPSATPTPTESETPSEEPSKEPSETPSVTPSESTPTPTPTPTKTEKPSETPKPSPTKTPKPQKVCVWEDGSEHALNADGTCPKDPIVIPRNENHKPDNNPPADPPEEKPVVPTQKAKPTTPAPAAPAKKPTPTKSTSPRSTQQAPDAQPVPKPKPETKPSSKPKPKPEAKPSSKPQPEETQQAEVPRVNTDNDESNNDDSPCINPVTGEAC